MKDALMSCAEARVPFEREFARRFMPTALLAPAPNGGSLPILAGRDVPAGAIGELLLRGPGMMSDRKSVV